MLDGAQTSIDELIGTASTVPFLSDKRLVIARGLLGSFERSRSAGRPAQANASSRTNTRLEAWKALPDRLNDLPPTTELVFVDGALSASNPILTRIKGQVDVQTFRIPSGNDLRRWIQERAAHHGLTLEQGAVAALADTVGQYLRVLDMEIQKLAAYAAGRTLRHSDVEDMVSYAKEASVFAAVDAVMEGRAGVAIRLVHQLLESGASATYVISMIARQLRLLILAKDLKAKRVPAAEMPKRLGVSGYPMQKTLEQEGRFSMQRLVEIHTRLLEADLALKSTGTDERMVLDLLVADLSIRPR
jgi:DNA polymerase-3 subunit delta